MTIKIRARGANPAERFTRLFIAIERAIWRGREINRRNVARAWIGIELESMRGGPMYRDVLSAARALTDLNNRIARSERAS